jgi:hypothetical protein
MQNILTAGKAYAIFLYFGYIFKYGEYNFKWLHIEPSSVQ